MAIYHQGEKDFAELMVKYPSVKEGYDKILDIINKSMFANKLKVVIHNTGELVSFDAIPDYNKIDPEFIDINRSSYFSLVANVRGIRARLSK